MNFSIAYIYFLNVFFSLNTFGFINLLAIACRSSCTLWFNLKRIGALFWKIKLNLSKHCVTLRRKHAYSFIWGSFNLFWIWADFWFSLTQNMKEKLAIGGEDGPNLSLKKSSVLDNAFGFSAGQHCRTLETLLGLFFVWNFSQSSSSTCQWAVLQVTLRAP